jgi:hypothetical protein
MLFGTVTGDGRVGVKKNEDIFIEEIIRRVRGTQEMLVKIGAVLLALILLTVVFIFIRLFFPFFFALICLLLFYVFKYTVKEYEYSFIDGDLDIDVILGMRKRKRVFSTGSREIKVMAPFSKNEPVPEGEYTEVLDASISKSSPNRWYFICHKEDGRRMLVFFNPSERLRRAFKAHLGVRMKDG